jgi:3D (Asp-Asp-Asp) domain-containing protein
MLTTGKTNTKKNVMDSDVKYIVFFALFWFFATGFFPNDGIKEIKKMEVRATAYNSVPEQTDDTPDEGAWGDILDPEIKSIAVSRDLLEMGLTKNTIVEIEGLPGKYLVLDKMNSRWEKKIDIFMGKDVDQALQWGIQTVTIKWEAEP